MKTMGLRQLYLVAPRVFPDPEAERLAAGAADVLAQARVVDSLAAAVGDCAWVVASSVRRREFARPLVTPRACAAQLLAHAKQGPVALVFGPERFGLSNADLQLARCQVAIPADPAYASLNLAASVQTLAYEIYQQHQGSASSQVSTERGSSMPSTVELEQFYAHLEKTFSATGFVRSQHPGQIMARLRQLFGRAQPDAMELNILRGMLASVQRTLDDQSGVTPKDRAAGPDESG